MRRLRSELLQRFPEKIFRRVLRKDSLVINEPANDVEKHPLRHAVDAFEDVACEMVRSLEERRVDGIV
jgi:hypothetical protein